MIRSRSARPDRSPDARRQRASGPVPECRVSWTSVRAAQRLITRCVSMPCRAISSAGARRKSIARPGHGDDERRGGSVRCAMPVTPQSTTDRLPSDPEARCPGRSRKCTAVVGGVLHVLELQPSLDLQPVAVEEIVEAKIRLVVLIAAAAHDLVLVGVENQAVRIAVEEGVPKYRLPLLGAVVIRLPSGRGCGCSVPESRHVAAESPLRLFDLSARRDVIDFFVNRLSVAAVRSGSGCCTDIRGEFASLPELLADHSPRGAA